MSDVQAGESSRRRRIHSDAPRVERGYSPLKIGIFAGTFDPVHDGHIAVAKTAVNYLGLDKLYFMVEESPWTAKKPVNVKYRKAMVELALSDNQKLELLNMTDKKFDVSTTLLKIEQLLPDSEFYFIFGADVFLNMNSANWQGLDKLLKHNIVVFERGKISESDISKHAKKLGVALAILPSAHPHHSSSVVRLTHNNRTLWVPKTVAKYIKDNAIY